MGLFSSYKEIHRVVPVVQEVVQKGMSADRATEVLAEFEAKARANIQKAFASKAGENTVGGVVFVSRDMASLDGFLVTAAFTLNGKKVVVSKTVKRSFDRKEAAKFLSEALSEQIAQHLLVNNLDAVKQFMG